MSKSIQEVLHQLGILIGDGPAPAYFNAPATADDISSFENQNNIRLPDSYKAFLLYANGGMIISDRLDNLLDYASNPEDVKWNANYLYSLEDMQKKYTDMESWNYGIPSGNISPYPFIPFCHTDTGEQLVFVTLDENKTESAVLDAYHEETPETWGVVADNFIEFLIDYVSSHGNPNVLGDLEKGSALDMIEDDIEEDEKNPEEILRETAERLEQDPEDDWQLVRRGSAFKDLGDVNAALDHFSMAIAIEPNDAYYYFCRGGLLLDAGKTRPALIDLDTAVKLESDDPLYLNMRAIALMDMGKLNKAMSDLNMAIRIDKKNVLSYMLRERLYTEIDEPEKAASDAAMVDELKKNEGKK